jgi:indole-3-glycerol phosphate synthase
VFQNVDRDAIKSITEMNLLEKIVKAKQRDIQLDKQKAPVALLEKGEFFLTPVRSLEKSLLEKEGFGIIAEFKKQSPSRGIINSSALPGEVCRQYFDSGAAAVSILTNGKFFGGSTADLLEARRSVGGPILRKEFIIDEYQIIESKSIGADAILLIADILSAHDLDRFFSLASSLRLEVLFEIHDISGIGKLPGGARLVGVNSRNLGTFSIDMDILKKTIKMLPAHTLKIAESGIDSVETLFRLNSKGFGGFLIGELFMRETDPAKACDSFISNLKKQKICK